MEIKARIQGSVICFFTITDKALFGVFYAIKRQSKKKILKKIKKTLFFHQHFNKQLRHYFKLLCLAEDILAGSE